MVGDKRKYNTALITLTAAGHTGDLPGTDELVGDAKVVNPACTTISAAKADPIWKAHLDAAIQKVAPTCTLCCCACARVWR